MDRTMKTAVQICGIIAIILLCAVIMNFGLAQTLGKGYLAGSIGKISIQQWVSGYHNVLYAVVAAALFASLLWYILARFVFRITSGMNVGRRTIWCILWAVETLLVIFLTWAVSNSLPKGFSLYIVHVIVFSIIGYYLTTLFFTPAPYKYTPVGADKLRRRK